MVKIRVYELAKELNKSSRDIIIALKRHGITVESHMSLLPGEVAERIRAYFEGAAQGKAASKAAPSAEKKAKAQTATKSADTQAGSDARKSKAATAKGRTAARSAQEAKNIVSQGTIDSRGNFVMSYEAVPDEAPVKTVRKSSKPKTKTEAEAEPKAEVRPEIKGEAGAGQETETKTEQGSEIKTEAERTEIPAPEKRQETEQTETKTEPGKTETEKEAAPAVKRSEVKAPRNDSRDDEKKRDKSGDKSKGRSSSKRFTSPMDSRSEGATPSKDSSRDSRRSHGKDRDNRKNDRDFDEMRRGEKGSRSAKNSSRSSHGPGRDHKKPSAPKPAPVVEKVSNIMIPENITIKDLADKMKIPAAQIIKKQFLAGKIFTINSDISYEEAEEIALEYDILCEHEPVVDVIEEMLKEEEDSEENMVTRPPVVCVMGHVDHGKTSILDAIRETNVTSGEAGGITQHIGAYMVDVKGQKITFLDTPGHEAFTEMRLRGAKSTDIAILVVAADDGVMPQTVEAINHAKAAGIDIIVAINKIDKPGANVDRVKQELMEHELIAEDWGGKTIMVPVSAHTREGLDDLLDMILLDSEVLDLKANPNRKGRGLILEAQLDKGRGAVATVLVQKGTLHVGDNVTCGTAYGKIRAMIDDKGRRVKTAGLSTPVEVLGLSGVPQSGEVFIATNTEKEARTMAETFIATNKEKMLQDTKSRLSLESLFEQIKEGQIKDLNIVVKADVQGSVEAIKQSLTKLSNEEVAVKVIHGGVGAINESDVMLASASNAIVVGFNVRPDNQAKIVAEQENVDMRLYRVIYNAIEDIEAAMKGMLEPEYQERIIGHAEVRQTYKVSSIGTIIGGYVQDGQITRNCRARLLRNNVVLYDGELGSLKRFKDDVKEVNSGFEFGMSFDKFNDIEEGDQVEAYVIEEIPR